MGYLFEYLIDQINWQKSIIFLLLSAGPTLLWLFICLRLDRSAPEPGLQIFKTFLWGCLITIPIIPLAGFLTRLIQNSSWFSPIVLIIVLSFLIDGFIEETSKYLVLRYKTYQSVHFDELRDGFIYGMSLGLGLAFIENVLYGFLVGDLMTGASTILLRGFTSTFMHFLSGGIIGYHLGLVKFNSVKKPKLIIFRGVIIAILFHGLYNTIVRFDWWWNLIPLAILLIVVYFLIFKKIKFISQSDLQAPKASH